MHFPLADCASAPIKMWVDDNDDAMRRAVDKKREDNYDNEEG
jgi:hypothetical protein